MTIDPWWNPPARTWPTTPMTITTTGGTTMPNSFWITFTPGDLSSLVVWPSELAALRHAVENGGKVIELPWGKEISWDFIDADVKRSST